MKINTRKNNKNTNNKTRKHKTIKPYKGDTIIMFKPNRKAIEIANQDVIKYLFREKVNVDRAIKQHNGFKQILKQQGQHFVDISEYVAKDTPSEQLANLLYTRDPFIKTSKGLVLGNMKEPARKHDREIIEKIMNKFHQPIIYKCKDDEKLEGGDFMMNCDTAFLGTGARSNMNAAKKLLKLSAFGTQKVVVIYPVKPEKSMYRIHLDCIFSPFGCKQCVIWNGLTHKDSVHKRMAIEYTLQNNGTYKRSGKAKNFVDYLKDNNYNIITLSNESQHNYGANILELDNGKVLVQDLETHKKIKGSIFVPFHEIHKMYGGLHCSSNSFFS
jgi:hypothetical protein